MSYTLEELTNAIDQHLREHGDKLMPWGLTDPKSYRGYYDELAFTKSDGPMQLSQAQANVLEADGATYQGWKGGQYTMGKHTNVHIADHGQWPGDTLSSLLVEMWLATGEEL